MKNSTVLKDVKDYERSLSGESQFIDHLLISKFRFNTKQTSCTDIEDKGLITLLVIFLIPKLSPLTTLRPSLRNRQ